MHQIIKRKKNKDGNVMVSTSSQIIDDDDYSSPIQNKTHEVVDIKLNSQSIDPNSWVNQDKISKFDEQLPIYGHTI